jgi:hypothetical protein
MEKKILLGFTTTNNINFENRFEEIDKYGIDEIALFPTVLDLAKRKELYDMLGHSSIKEIPHVHIRHDFEDWEFDHFIQKYNTKAFNIHPAPGLKKLSNEYRKFNHLIYIENLAAIDDHFMKALDLTAGICIDFSHWEDAIVLGWDGYDRFEELINAHAVGCSHISAVRKKTYSDKFILIGEKGEEIVVEKTVYNCHRMDEFDEMDYIKRNARYLPELISIELENSFGEQLEVKKYLESIIING